MTRPDILIVGQGLAGTLLAWEFEQAGIAFAIADGGHAAAASAVAAGIINPITGRRLVKSWRYETLFPFARASYVALERVLEVKLWHDMRVRRWFADERERAVGSDPQRRAELADYIVATDEAGWWIGRATRVDLPALLQACRARWAAMGVLRPETVKLDREVGRYEVVIDCRGRAGAESGAFGFVPWEFSKGELLELAIDGLEPDVILNRRTWIAPVRPGAAMAGATHLPGVRDAAPSERGRATIEESVRGMLEVGQTFTVTAHRAGVRVNLPDKRPVAGRHPANPRLGVINALGAKGALWAPMLARQWVNHLTEGVAFDADIDVRRFASRL